MFHPLGHVPQHSLGGGVAITYGALEKKLRRGVKEGLVNAPDYATQLVEAVTAGVLTEDEAEKLRDLDAKVMNLIHVDDFAPGAFARKPEAAPVAPQAPRVVKTPPPPEAMEA